MLPGPFENGYRRDDTSDVVPPAPGNTVMVVPVRTTPQFEAGVPEALFAARIRHYSVSRDGQRSLLIPLPPPGPTAVAPPLTGVLSWFEQLKARVPTR